MRIMLKTALYVAMLSVLSLSGFSAVAATADKEATVKQQLLKLGAEKVCDPESEMYCKAHTAFVFEKDAVVLLSVQPTAGLFVVLQQDKVGQWIARETHSLLDYEDVLTESKLSKASQAYFIQAVTAYLASRKARSKN